MRFFDMLRSVEEIDSPQTDLTLFYMLLVKV